MEFLVGTGLALVALGLALFVGVPPPGWPTMPKPLIRFCLGTGVCLFVTGLLLMGIGGCHESDVHACRFVVLEWSKIKGWVLIPIVLFVLLGGFVGVSQQSENSRRRRLNAWGPWVLIFGGPLLGIIWLVLARSPNSGADITFHDAKIASPEPQTAPKANPPSRQLYSDTEKLQTIDALGELSVDLKNLDETLRSTIGAFNMYTQPGGMNNFVHVPIIVPIDREEYRKQQTAEFMTTLAKRLSILLGEINRTTTSAREISERYPRKVEDVTAVFFNAPRSNSSVVTSIDSFRLALVEAAAAREIPSSFMTYNELFLERVRPFRVQVDQAATTIDARIRALRQP